MISPELVASVFRASCESLPPNTADLLISESCNDIRLVPRNPASARVTAHLDGDMLYLEFGRGLVSEVRISAAPSFEKELSIVRLIVNAAVGGLITEDVWESDGKLVSSRGEFVIGDKKHRFWFNLLGRFFRHAHRKTYTYAPYSGVAEHASSD
jgi:hypothetical protein